MDESPAMRERWQSVMSLRNAEETTVSARHGRTSGQEVLPKRRKEENKDVVHFLDSGKCNMATGFRSIVNDISKSHPTIQSHLKVVENLFKQVGRSLQSIRGPPMLASATTTALSTLSTTTPSLWSPSLIDEELFKPESSTKDQSFDAFLDGRDLLIGPTKVRPSWVKDPAERTLALAEEVAQNAVEGWSGFIRPVDKMWQISSTFGPRWGRHHNGVDLAAPTGEPVLASDSGEVTFAGWESGYGNLVEITHRDGWKTLYAHNSELFTWEGQFVRRGECIASVGETGRATGPHLHWEIRNESGKPVDPCDHMKL